jgi:hypothetical protein
LGGDSTLLSTSPDLKPTAPHPENPQKKPNLITALLFFSHNQFKQVEEHSQQLLPQPAYK